MTEQASISNRAWAELVLLAFIWGGSFLAIRYALDEIPPLTSVLHRVFWAALVLWVIVILRGLPVPTTKWVWLACLVMGFLNNVIPFCLMAWAQLHIESGLTSIYNAATAIWGVLVAALFLGDERLTARKGLGVLLGFGGVFMAIGFDALRSFDLRSMAQLAVLAGTLSYAFAGIWARKKLSSLPPEIAAAGMLTTSAILMLPIVLVLDGPPSFDLESTTWISIGYYALVATALAYLLYYRVLAMAGAGNLLLVTLLIPPVAITLGTLIRGEALAPNAVLGFALLALGLIVLDGRVFARKAKC